MKKINKFRRYLLVTCIFIVAICCLLVAAIRVTGLKNHVRFLAVISGSMEPEIKLGSTVFVQSKDKYHPGDVVSYISTDGAIVTHRITSEKTLENGDVIFETKGDANDSKDPKSISISAVIGKVIISVPLLGYVTTFLQTPIGLTILVIIPTMIFITLESTNLITSVNNYKKRKIIKTITLTMLMFASIYSTVQRSYSKMSVEDTVQAKFESTTWQTLKFYFNREKNSVGFEITNIPQFDQIVYKITYRSLTEDGVIDQQIEAGIPNPEHHQKITEQWIVLGFCSSGGTCVYDTLASPITIEAKLVRSGNVVKTLSKTI